jgi:hypothetical protein
MFVLMTTSEVVKVAFFLKSSSFTTTFNPDDSATELTKPLEKLLY